MRVLAAASALLMVLSPSAAQTGKTQPVEGKPTFSADVRVVNVLATVKDRRGRLVNTFGKEDFVLSEDGVRQEIRYFAHQTDLPLTIGLLIDTSGSQDDLIPDERRAGSQFFQSVLRPERDLAFLMSFDVNVELLQDYTSSLGLLEQGLDELQVEKPTRGSRRNRTGNKKRTSTALYDALFLAADELFRNLVGRKVVVVISDGFDVRSKVSLEAAIEAALRSDVVVYAIQYFDRYQYQVNPMSYRRSATRALKEMATETGGSFFTVSRTMRLSTIFQQIEDEMRSQYSIGHSPQPEPGRSGFRKIRLKSPRKGVKVQARAGYYPDTI